MRFSHLKHYLTYLFLALFILMKVTGLHAMADDDHKDKIVHCALCDFVATSNNTPILSPDVIEFNTENTKLTKRNITGEYHFIYCTSGIPNHLFSRPPPVFL